MDSWPSWTSRLDLICRGLTCDDIQSCLIVLHWPERLRDTVNKSTISAKTLLRLLEQDDLLTDGRYLAQVLMQAGRIDLACAADPIPAAIEFICKELPAPSDWKKICRTLGVETKDFQVAAQKSQDPKEQLSICLTNWAAKQKADQASASLITLFKALEEHEKNRTAKRLVAYLLSLMPGLDNSTSRMS